MKLEQLKRGRENKGAPVTNSLLAGVVCGGGGDAGDGVSQTQPGTGPQAQLSQGVDHGDGPQAEPHIMSKSAAKLSSCQQTHEEAATATPTPDSQQWTLTHMRQLGECVKGLLCPDCYGDDVFICISGHMGFSSELTLRCQSCPYTKKVHTSPTVGSTKAYAINTVMTVLAHELGVAHAGLEKIGKVLGIPPMHLNPVYKRMSDDNMLKRMQHGKTQNQNECFNSTIWIRCPKSSFRGMKRVQGAIPRAAEVFNEGAMSLTRVVDKLYIEPTQCMLTENRKRIAQADKQADEKAIRKRKAEDEKKRAKLAAQEAVEGVQ